MNSKLISFHASIYIAIINAGICHTPLAVQLKAWALELDYETQQEELLNAHIYRTINPLLPNILLHYISIKHSNKPAHIYHSIFSQQIWLIQYFCPTYIQNELLNWMTKWIHDYNSCLTRQE